jgi:hypothetical protein
LNVQLRIPAGIRNSVIISCDIGESAAIQDCPYISHYIIGDRVILSRIDEMQATNHAKFGNGILKDGAKSRDVSLAADEVFNKARKSMPHALGHGIGLEAHEAPYLRSRPDNTALLQEGMVFTLEPGLYDPIQGGCRLENDILISSEGVEVLTNSHIIRL